MSFHTILYHEIREAAVFDPSHPSPIEVKQDYTDALPSLLFVTLENFKEQMNYLKKQGAHTLTLDEVRDFYYQDKSLPDKSILITFDDCYQALKRYAYPILKEYGFHAVVFTVTGWLNTNPADFTPERSVCLTEEDLTPMADVFEYANHTHHFHTRSSIQTGRIMTETDEAFAADLAACNRYPLISAKDTFAYPFGLLEERNVKLLNREHFKLAFTCINGSNEKDTNPLLLKRNVIPYSADIDTFKTLGGLL
ncbi:polysaccharide deacetylase family protein [Anaerocolumna xylanovorans]|uniref:Peptidoglycan/xylan/chitin deacetylase, PgdA/CDA1 family n=1 Tax=Anaerocolumna xylanovorans DSM 12503 TaxID=1121345 RepID=A0A1M7YJC5_9FIRM|nr:polysaccharide deacetylase family protein [Anaerocolumna xylanovorans]SHO52711.1 Peptidoglycan/xylan/chitin deacetylase, PgdA/CDA1 family [Anaerocolumna xylanovorans DSM 12503]